VQPRYQRVVLPNFWPSTAKEGSRTEDNLNGDSRNDDDVAVEDDEEGSM